jgi:hypothetical protein
MAPIPTSEKTRQLREVPGNSVMIGANQDTTCFSIYSVPEREIIHICDWPAFVGAVARLMEDRADDGINYRP